MAGVVFSHPNPSVGTLNIRLAPTQVDWSYELNTTTQNTYAGQVVQLLSINFDKFTIMGQFGREGPWGRGIVNGRYLPRKVSDRADYRGGSGPYRVGLTQMTEYFRRYFAVASQGRDARAQGHFDEKPMRVTYQGALDIDVDDGIKDGDWLIYPVSFPSYRRSNEDFAPEWRVEGQVVEADSNIERVSMEAEINKLREAVGFTHFNPYSDPFAPTGVNPKTNLTPKRLEQLYKQARKDALENALERVDHYHTIIPEYTDEALEELLYYGSRKWDIAPGTSADQQDRQRNGDDQ